MGQAEGGTVSVPEDDFEAAVWQAMHNYRVTTGEPQSFIDTILLAAQRYAASDSEIVTALRRQVLGRDA